MLATNEVAGSWKDARILPIFKKGDGTRCENYWGISLLNESHEYFLK
jgi:hypothetical protein